jgi:hypothetical protein
MQQNLKSLMKVSLHLITDGSILLKTFFFKIVLLHTFCIKIGEEFLYKPARAGKHDLYQRRYSPNSRDLSTRLAWL